MATIATTALSATAHCTGPRAARAFRRSRRGSRDRRGRGAAGGGTATGGENRHLPASGARQIYTRLCIQQTREYTMRASACNDVAIEGSSTTTRGWLQCAHLFGRRDGTRRRADPRCAERILEPPALTAHARARVITHHELVYADRTMNRVIEPSNRTE